ncbi:MAG: putative RNA polymerase sigma factor [uncultured Corynebacteriales bacterium]|uniref:Putative RNA polymerase sigma factor n=1 Tax=uncultured Mycobacteriales bacterium TaxID=581187 RepID=A0A6J4JAE8_9ACTN|nr:MAG: putative RNA polymerase sigma factor [uncultured Corynebacteriales bacterium]
MADRGTFDEFVATRSQVLLRTAYLLTGERASAEDLLQTALAKSWFAWGRIDGAPEPYVRRVLATTYATWWRRRWRAEYPTGELPETPVPGDSSVEDRDALWRALGTLPRRQRAVIVLRYYEDLSEAQTAAALGVSVGTVKSQASRALAALRRDPDLTNSHGGGR